LILAKATSSSDWGKTVVTVSADDPNIFDGGFAGLTVRVPERVQVVDDCEVFTQRPIELFKAETATITARPPMALGCGSQGRIAHTAGQPGGPSFSLKEPALTFDRRHFLPEHFGQEVGRRVTQETVSPDLTCQ